MSELKFTKFF